MLPRQKARRSPRDTHPTTLVTRSGVCVWLRASSFGLCVHSLAVEERRSVVVETTRDELFVPTSVTGETTTRLMVVVVVEKKRQIGY